jgi:hypothetical protein
MADSFQLRKAGGVGGWTEEEEEGWRGEVAESYYLDMIRDSSRNEAYQDALNRAIERFHSESSAVHVFDIGTGSGLLAMMACSAGAHDVTACECFAPVARSAARCIAANNLHENITLVTKASSEMTLGDMRGGKRANILVRMSGRTRSLRMYNFFC